MPTEFLPDDERTRIREELRTHMSVESLSSRKIARMIRQHPGLRGADGLHYSTIDRFLDTTSPKVVTVSSRRVRCIERYLAWYAEQKRSRSVTSGDLPGTSLSNSRLDSADETSRLFSVLRVFFAMRPAKEKEFLDVTRGIYAFHAYSEDGASHVCQGAIEFFVNEHGGFAVRELQQSVPAGTNQTFQEEYSGAFFFRDTVAIVIQREKDRSIPKMYILSIKTYKTTNGEVGQIMVMEGVLVKIGAKRKVFTSNIRLYRNDSAFKECAVLPRIKIDSQILDYLDGDEWRSRR